MRESRAITSPRRAVGDDVYSESSVTAPLANDGKSCGKVRESRATTSPRRVEVSAAVGDDV